MSRTNQEAKSLGRPQRFKGEKTVPLSYRVPTSVAEHLTSGGQSVHSAAQEVTLFEKDLSDRLKPMLLDIRVNAAMHGQDYGTSRAETLARLVKTGLAADKKQKSARQS